jgi:hypothetical protein
MPMPDNTIPLPRRMPAGNVNVGPAIEPICTNLLRW